MSTKWVRVSLGLLFCIAIISIPGMAAVICPWDTPAEGIPPSTTVNSGIMMVASVGNGMVSSQLEATHESFGTITGSSLYTATVLGRSSTGLEYATTATLSPTAISGQYAASIGTGRISGESTSGMTYAFTEEITDQENATVIPFCEKILVSDGFDLSQGVAASQATITPPATSSFLMHQAAVQGNGIGTFSAGYRMIDGFTLSRIDSMESRIRVSGDGIILASQFDYSAVR